MATSVRTEWFADCFTPLSAEFGDALTLQRDGAAARWTYEGQSVIVAPGPSGALAADFVERPTVEGVSALPASGVYRSATLYHPTPEGCNRMISDMLAFFSGTREPRFVFADAYFADV